MTLDVRLRGYQPNGASVGLLPAPGDWDLSAPLNDIPALKLDYSVGAPRSELLGQPLEIALEASGDGGQTWTEPDGCRFLYLKDGRDPMKPADSWQVDAPGYLWLLKKARVAFNPADVNPGKRSYDYPVTPGHVLGFFFLETKLRGGLAGMTQTFTDTQDSNGTPWPETLLRTYDAGVDLLAVLMDLADSGYVDFTTSGRDLNLYVPEKGVDRTVGNSQVTLAATSSPSAPFRRTWEGVAGALLGTGDGGLSMEYVNPSAVQPWGRWEDYVTHAGVTDPGTLTALLQHQGNLTEGPRLEFTQEVETATGPRPFFDYRPGDYVWSRSLAGARDRYRVRQITVGSRAGRVTGNVVLNDRFLEADIRLQRKLTALAGGATAGGSTGGLPGADILPPAAPTQPLLSSTFYTDGAGQPHAQITVDWADVTTNMDGTPLTDLARYQVWSKPSGSAAWSLVAETTGASIAFLSPYPPGTEWDFRVQAEDSSGNRSDYSPTASVLTALDQVAPAVPSKPTVTSGGGLIEVTWDGENAAGNAQAEPDLFRVEVHISSTSGYVPTPGSSATMVGSFIGPGRVAIPGYAVGSTYYVRLVAVDTSLNASNASAVTPVTVVNTVSDGQAPNTAGWTVNLEPLGLMALGVSWTALANTDALTYRVYASSTTPVPRNSSTLVGKTGGTGLSFGAINGVALVAGVGYYVAVVPEDADGDGTAVQDGPTTIRQADEGSVADEWTYTGPISASQLQTGSLSATLAIIGELTTAATGRNISISTAGGFRAIGPTGDLVASIPTDATQDIAFEADVVAKSLTALGPVAMRATGNELAPGAVLALRSNTTSPVSPPVVSIEWASLGNVVGYPDFFYGGQHHQASNRIYRAESVWGISNVTWLNATTGAVIDAISVASEGINTFAAARYGDVVYALTQEAAGWFIRRYNALTKAYLGIWTLGDGSAFQGRPTMTIQESTGYLVIVYQEPSTAQIRRHSYNRDTGAVINQDTTGFSLPTGEVLAAVESPADVGAPRLWVVHSSNPGTAFAFFANPGTGNYGRAPEQDFSTAYAHQVGFLTWDSTRARFVSNSRATGEWFIYESGNNWGPESANWYVTNTWRDTDTVGGTFETAQGPPASIVMKRRARLVVTTPPIPTDANNLNRDDPNAVAIYVGRGDGLRGTQFRQAQPANGVRTATLTNVIFSNADTQHPNPPAAGNFPNGTPGLIRSAAEDANGPLFWVDGQGAGRWKARDGDKKLVSGLANLTFAANTRGTGVIVSLAGMGFTSAPIIVVSAQDARFVAGAYNISASQFTLDAYFEGTTVGTVPFPLVVSWHAHGAG